MLTDPQIAVAVVVVAVITFACRIAPFALLRGRRAKKNSLELCRFYRFFIFRIQHRKLLYI